jgi:hypothetical protein
MHELLRNPNHSRPPRSVLLEQLEPRRLASVSYIQVGRSIRPDIVAQVPSYFGYDLPTRDYLIQFVGGSLTYFNGGHPLVYTVNDYDNGDSGYKVVIPGSPRFDAPGLSAPETNSIVASRDSYGLYVEFRHHGAGKIGIEMLDDPIGDNVPGSEGSPVFILKERVVTPAATPAASAAQPHAAVLTESTSAPFSAIPIANSAIDPELALPDKLVLLT